MAAFGDRAIATAAAHAEHEARDLCTQLPAVAAARPRRRSGARVPRPDPAGAENLLRALPPYAAGTLGLVGDLDAMRARVDACAEAGLDEIDLDPVPATAADPAGDRMLTALKPA